MRCDSIERKRRRDEAIRRHASPPLHTAEVISAGVRRFWRKRGLVDDPELTSTRNFTFGRGNSKRHKSELAELDDYIANLEAQCA